MCFAEKNLPSTMQIKKLMSLPSRTGRDLQRYNQGYRQVVGCIPYRFKKSNDSLANQGALIEEVEVLLISSQKSSRMMFPKGGWEIDEDIQLAASRETLEEAGVVGLLGEKLGEWVFKSRSQEKFHEGSMFPLLVTEELDIWPEKDVRQRTWMSVNEAKEVCTHWWMKKALDKFVLQFTGMQRKEEECLLPSCRLEYDISDESRKTIGGAQNAEEQVDYYLEGVCKKLFSLTFFSYIFKFKCNQTNHIHISRRTQVYQ